jgi:hypothetical protein
LVIRRNDGHEDTVGRKVGLERFGENLARRLSIFPLGDPRCEFCCGSELGKMISELMMTVSITILAVAEVSCVVQWARVARRACDVRRVRGNHRTDSLSLSRRAGPHFISLRNPEKTANSAEDLFLRVRQADAYTDGVALRIGGGRHGFYLTFMRATVNNYGRRSIDLQVLGNRSRNSEDHKQRIELYNIEHDRVIGRGELANVFMNLRNDSFDGRKELSSGDLDFDPFCL